MNEALVRMIVGYKYLDIYVLLISKFLLSFSVSVMFLGGSSFEFFSYFFSYKYFVIIMNINSINDLIVYFHLKIMSYSGVKLYGN